jgi:hypothetical protein
VALLAGLALVACAGDSAPGAWVSGAATPAPGVKVYLDPVTGKPREPTREELAPHDQADRAKPAAAGGQAGSEGRRREHFVLPDGTEGVKLLPTDRHSLVVCEQADGSLGTQCPKTTPDLKP